MSKSCNHNDPHTVTFVSSDFKLEKPDTSNFTLGKLGIFTYQCNTCNSLIYKDGSKTYTDSSHPDVWFIYKYRELYCISTLVKIGYRTWFSNEMGLNTIKIWKGKQAVDWVIMVKKYYEKYEELKKKYTFDEFTALTYKIKYIYPFELPSERHVLLEIHYTDGFIDYRESCFASDYFSHLGDRISMCAHHGINFDIPSPSEITQKN